MSDMKSGARDDTPAAGNSGPIAKKISEARANLPYKPVGRRSGEGSSSVLEHLQADSKRVPPAHAFTTRDRKDSSPHEASRDEDSRLRP